MGLSARPYVTALSVDGVDQLLGTPTGVSDSSKWDSNKMQVNIGATNVCRTGQTPAQGVCYANPNRIDVAFGFNNGTNLITNFAHSSISGKGISTSSVIDVTINLNGYSTSLGWTWVNGEPTYWKVDPTTQTLRVKFSPRYMPSSHNLENSCTTIPVSTCNTDTAFAELLQGSMIISVDTTASAFAGALFASAGSIIGSLEVPGTLNSSSSLTYGIAAPHNFAADYTPPGATSPGGVRKGTFYGFVPNTILTSGFGLTDPSQASSLMTIARTTASSGGTDTVTWAPWTAAANGTDGQLVTISDITFSAPKFQMKRKAGIKKGAKRTKSQLLSDVGISLAKGEKVSIKVAKASKKICKVSGTSIKGTKAGICSYTVTVKKKGKKVAGKTKSGTIAIS